ncbi:hypothetical protein [Kineosporia sp. NBRC 101731]|uniref:hypothetical protein n=1 Tax=Kineosporia sp. NBRC 101731 TaxID=3032199 RepID=UPI0024A062C4|nr:hypothetical protein [Kineosporia sp. NBRC 101731]GLY28939.1 hypothetical protein Kisp02_23040 [Kineosporia sp. NBRC 101731]
MADDFLVRPDSLAEANEGMRGNHTTLMGFSDDLMNNLKMIPDAQFGSAQELWAQNQQGFNSVYGDVTTNFQQNNLAATNVHQTYVEGNARSAAAIQG